MIESIKLWALKNIAMIALVVLAIVICSTILVVKKYQKTSEDVRNAKEVIWSPDSVYDLIISKLPKSDK